MKKKLREVSILNFASLEVPLDRRVCPLGGPASQNHMELNGEITIQVLHGSRRTFRSRIPKFTFHGK